MPELAEQDRAGKTGGTNPKWVRRTGLLLGIGAFFAIEWGAVMIGSPAREAAAVAALMASWWLTEAISIYATSCLPLLLFPLLGIFGRGQEGGTAFDSLLHNVWESASPFWNAYIFLFMGGMALAAAMQETLLHKRIALGILRAVGIQPARLLLGFLLATAFISLWISNTATAAMMVPIGMAVMAELEAQNAGRSIRNYACAVMLSIAYGANIGGIGTKIGTAPNAQFCGFMEQNLKISISFVDFVMIGLPFVLAFLPITWWVLWLGARRDSPRGHADKVEEEWRALGAMQWGEKIALSTFLLAASLWIASSQIHALLKPGLTWLKTNHLEAAIAMFCGFSLLLVRKRGARAPLTAAGLRKVPWQTLLLLGGGFSLAAGVEASGLSRWMAEQLAFTRDLPAFAQLALVSFLTVFASAFASNTATIAVMLTVIHSAVAAAEAPAALAAATIACSCDFMLPVGTPPNAIVFGSGYVTIPRMATTGFVLDLGAAALTTIWATLGLRLMFAPA